MAKKDDIEFYNWGHSKNPSDPYKFDKGPSEHTIGAVILWILIIGLLIWLA